MTYFFALELIAKHKIWESECISTAVRGRILIRRRQYWHEAIHEWQGGGGSLKLVVAFLSVHTLAKNPRPVSRMQAYNA